MDMLTRQDIKELITDKNAHLISLFMPAVRKGAETTQNPIRFKNLLAEAERILSERNMKSAEIGKLLEQSKQLIRNRFFWEKQNDGLAVFISSDTFRYFRLPVSFEELVVVSNRFHVKPLIPLLSGNGRFFVLALSKNEVRVFRGSRFEVQELDLETLPENFSAILKYKNFEKQLQFHTRTSARQEKRSAMFHGHGTGPDDEQDDLLIYFREIDRGLRELLRNEHAPLVLAGVDYLYSLYRKANSYPHLADKGVTGSPDTMSVPELHERAWKIVQPLFHKAQEDAAGLYRELAATDRTSNELETVVPSAYYGRVDTLFVPLHIREWGTFDTDGGTVHIHDRREPHDEDLLDFTAAHTLVNGGMVYAVDNDDLPGEGIVAAVFRYQQ